MLVKVFLTAGKCEWRRGRRRRTGLGREEEGGVRERRRGRIEGGEVVGKGEGGRSERGGAASEITGGPAEGNELVGDLPAVASKLPP